MIRSGADPSHFPNLPAVARWIAAVLCFLYGFAKINGSQFTVLDSELARPMGEVSGFWLTWYYFGYSAAYGTILALVQIGAGVLLIMPRTALAGALLLLPVVGNIVLIDVLYGVDLGGTLAAVVLGVCVLVTIAPYRKRLLNAVLLGTQPRLPSYPSLAALAIVTGLSFGFTWWVANYNNRVPTRIDGVWTAVSQPESKAASGWEQVFFERNRAHLVVFRAPGRPDERHHFEIDTEGTIRVWEVWLAKGALLMQGRLRGQTEMDLEPVSGRVGGPLVLQRALQLPQAQRVP